MLSPAGVAMQVSNSSPGATPPATPPSEEARELLSAAVQHEESSGNATNARELVNAKQGRKSFQASPLLVYTPQSSTLDGADFSTFLSTAYQNAAVAGTSFVLWLSLLFSVLCMQQFLTAMPLCGDLQHKSCLFALQECA